MTVLICKSSLLNLTTHEKDSGKEILNIEEDENGNEEKGNTGKFVSNSFYF